MTRYAFQSVDPGVYMTCFGARGHVCANPASHAIYDIEYREGRRVMGFYCIGHISDGKSRADELNRLDVEQPSYAPMDAVTRAQQLAADERSKAPAEQPAPTGNGTEITPLVIADLLERSRKGAAQYGTPLRAHNGRDALRDLYEEILDAAQYCRQEIEEREREDASLCDEIARLTDRAISAEAGMCKLAVEAQSYAEALDGAQSLDRVMRDITAWQRETFPGASLKGAVKHLIKEAAEVARAAEAVERGGDGAVAHLHEELADCVFMIAQAFSVTDPSHGIIAALRRKLEINKSRTWQRPDPVTGVVEHVRDEPAVIDDDGEVG